MNGRQQRLTMEGAARLLRAAGDRLAVAGQRVLDDDADASDEAREQLELAVATWDDLTGREQKG